MPGPFDILDQNMIPENPGDVVLEAPVAATIQALAISIADAQYYLNQNSIETAKELGQFFVDFTDSTTGNIVSKSLLELGFSPTFYHFSETTLEVSFTMSLRVEQSFDVGFSLHPSTSPPSGSGEFIKTLSALGIAASVNYHRKYGFDMTGASKITTKMLSLPGPPQFLAAIHAYYH